MLKKIGAKCLGANVFLHPRCSPKAIKNPLQEAMKMMEDCKKEMRSRDGDMQAMHDALDSHNRTLVLQNETIAGYERAYAVLRDTSKAVDEALTRSQVRAKILDESTFWERVVGWKLRRHYANIYGTLGKLPPEMEEVPEK